MVRGPTRIWKSPPEGAGSSEQFLWAFVPRLRRGFLGFDVARICSGEPGLEIGRFWISFIFRCFGFRAKPALQISVLHHDRHANSDLLHVQAAPRVGAEVEFLAFAAWILS